VIYKEELMLKMDVEEEFKKIKLKAGYYFNIDLEELFKYLEGKIKKYPNKTRELVFRIYRVTKPVNWELGDLYNLIMVFLRNFKLYNLFKIFGSHYFNYKVEEEYNKFLSWYLHKNDRVVFEKLRCSDVDDFLIFSLVKLKLPKFMTAALIMNNLYMNYMKKKNWGWYMEI
jgi:hypothetical protein